MSNNLEENIQEIKETITKPLPHPPSLKNKSSANALKERLEWGEPALTIIDVRDREAFNKQHITGAMPMPMDVLVETAKSSLEMNRDIYIYGETDEKTSQAASALREAGFNSIAELEGGLPGWQAISGPTEGREFNAAYSDK